MLARMHGVKRKLSIYAEEEARLHSSLEARINHLDELYNLKTTDDVKYEDWSRKRLDRLVADYFLRNGFHESATMLCQERCMGGLVDCETFAASGKIRTALLNESVAEALAWCQENKKELRKMDVSVSFLPPSLYAITEHTQSKLEFMLRLQQYIELVRTASHPKLIEAIAHAKKHIIPNRAQFPREVQQACGLLALPPTANIRGVYAELYSPRWSELADLFTSTHNQLLSLPSVPLLHVALSSGLSALKTPLCHSHNRTRTISHDEGGPAKGVCPICSIELNDLAKHVPYAHHTKSHVQPDLVMLPSGKARGKQALLDEGRKAGLGVNEVRDPSDGSIYDVTHLQRVFIT